MKFKAFAPELRFTDPEPFALAQERAVDHDAIQRLAAQKLRHQAEAALLQLTLESASQAARPPPSSFRLLPSSFRCCAFTALVPY